MKNIPRFLMILAGVLMLGLFLFPMWRITLLAPQYPDGVSLHIWINKIVGAEPGSLQNINILNHYVGMKPIVPESIPELKYFPYVIAMFTALAFIAAATNSKQLFLLWFIIVVVGAVLGMYDFYIWEYNYGHDLSKTAPMKFDESFQPPLIGQKTILNFVAKSYPHIGGVLAFISIIVGGIGTLMRYKVKQYEQSLV